MSVVATVLKPGIETTVQDAGRTQFRHVGTPQSGAADRLSFALTNAAVGNDWDAPALECASLGPTLQFEADTAFAIGGADMAATLNDAPATRYTLHHAKAGDILALHAAKAGLRSYIAIAGGVIGRAALGSVSTYAPASLGGIGGRALRQDDQIEGANAPCAAPLDIPASLAPPITNDAVLRMVRGPEFHLLDAAAQKQFLSEAFIASRRANRMGVELTGRAICPPAEFSMLSSPVYPGTVQCPPSGNPFLLLADAQTVGGYARIAQVVDADLHLAAQIRPDAKIWFSAITASEAREIAAQQTAFYAAYLPGFRFG